MTLSIIALFAVAGSMLALKLAVMMFAVVLLAKAMSPKRNALAPSPTAAARLSRHKEKHR